MRLTEAGRGCQFEVPVGTLLARRFMGDDDDAFFLGLSEHRLEHLGIVRHHADHLHALCNEVFDGAHLQRRIGAGRADHEGVDAELLAALLDARFHGVEPWDTTDLDYDADLAGILSKGSRRAGKRQRCRQGGDENFPDHVSPPLVPKKERARSPSKRRPPVSNHHWRSASSPP
ncbi:hypothetical protein D9M68_574070 [compost metagenome]